MPGPYGTAVLDNFNRANEGPPPSSSWTLLRNNSLKVVSNVCAPGTVSGFSRDAAYWNVRDFGPDVEAHMLLSTLPDLTNEHVLTWRLTNIGVGTTNGYGLVVKHDGGNNPLWEVRRTDNDTDVPIGADFTTPFSAGDSAAAAMFGSTIEVWHKPSAGGWTLLGTRTDATYSAAGKIGAELTSSNGGPVRFDDFGGGNIDAATSRWKIPLFSGRPTSFRG